MIHHALTVVLWLILQILGDHLIVIDDYGSRYADLSRRIRQSQNVHNLILKPLLHLCLKIQTAQTVAGQTSHIVGYHLLHGLGVDYSHVLRQKPGNTVGNQVLDRAHLLR